MKISPNKFEENSKNSKAHMNMNTRTPKSTYMKIQVRTINLTRNKKTKKHKINRQKQDMKTTRNYEKNRRRSYNLSSEYQMMEKSSSSSSDLCNFFFG